MMNDDVEMACGGSDDESVDKLDPEDAQLRICDEIRIVLLGKPGSGKSATGNTILRKRNFFKESSLPRSQTERCKFGCSTNNDNNQKCIVIDTPDFEDTRFPADFINKEIIKCIGLASPGPHALLYTLRIGLKLTEEDSESFENMTKLFGDSMFDYTIIVLTSADIISWPRADFRREYIKRLPDFFKEKFERCGNRVVFFNNYAKRDENEYQLQELFSCIYTLRGKELEYYTYFTNEMFVKAEEVIQKRINQIKGQEGNRPKHSLRLDIRHELEDEGETFKALFKVPKDYRLFTVLAFEMSLIAMQRIFNM